MSLVGPRPNVKSGVDLYTEQEMKLISVRPGITDLSSIVFSDEGAILEGSDDPDLKYNQVIRPWKSRLGILYIDNMSALLDLKIIGAWPSAVPHPLLFFSTHWPAKVAAHTARPQDDNSAITQ